MNNFKSGEGRYRSRIAALPKNNPCKSVSSV